MGLAYVHMRRFEEAAACFEEAKKIYEMLPIGPDLISAIYSISVTYSAMNMNPAALSSANDALEMAEKNGSLIYQSASMMELSTIYEKLGNYKEALKYSKMAQAVSDSISQQSVGQRTSDMEAVYNLAKANDDMSNLKQRIKYDAQIRYFFMGSSLLLFLVVGLLTSLYMQKKRHERKLEIEIAARKKTEEELNQSVAQLQRSLVEVKTLSGLLPICSSCKKIRSDKGYWEHLEKYIQTHSDAKFTHGICPECMQKLYPEYDKSSEGKITDN